MTTEESQAFMYRELTGRVCVPFVVSGGNDTPSATVEFTMAPVQTDFKPLLR